MTKLGTFFQVNDTQHADGKVELRIKHPVYGEVLWLTFVTKERAIELLEIIASDATRIVEEMQG